MFPWQFDDFVAFYVLAGNAIVTPKGAWLFHRILMLRAGDMVLLPRGFAADWQCFPAITLRWVRGETPPAAFQIGLPRALEDLTNIGMGTHGQLLPGLWAQAPKPPPAVAHPRAAPGPDVASPSGPPPSFPADVSPAYVSVPDCAPPSTGHCPDAELGGGRLVPAEFAASMGASPSAPVGPAPPQPVLSEGGSAPSSPASGWIPLVDPQGNLHWWDTVAGRTTARLPDELVTHGPAA